MVTCLHNLQIQDKKSGYSKLSRVEKFILLVGAYEEKIFKKRSDLQERRLKNLCKNSTNVSFLNTLKHIHIRYIFNHLTHLWILIQCWNYVTRFEFYNSSAGGRREQYWQFNVCCN